MLRRMFLALLASGSVLTQACGVAPTTAEGEESELRTAIPSAHHECERWGARGWAGCALDHEDYHRHHRHHQRGGGHPGPCPSIVGVSVAPVSSSAGATFVLDAEPSISRTTLSSRDSRG